MPTTSPRSTAPPDGRSSPIRCRRCATSTAAWRTADGLLRHPGFAEDHRPDVIVRLGRPASSKVLAQWARRDRRSTDPGRRAGRHRPGPQRDRRVFDGRPFGRDERRIGGGSGATGWSEAGRPPMRWRRDDRGRARPRDGTHRARRGAGGRDRAPDGARARRSRRRCRCAISSGSGGRSAAAPTPIGAPTGSTASSRPHSAARSTAAPSVVLLGDLAFVHDSNALVPAGPRRRPARSSSSTTTGVASSRSSPRPPSSPPIGSSSCSARPSAPTCSRSPAPTASRPPRSRRRPIWSASSHGRAHGSARVPSDRQRNVVVHDRLHAAVAAALDARG